MKNQSLSRETDLADVRIHLAPTFTRSEPRRFLSLGLYERWNQEKKSYYDYSNEGASQGDQFIHQFIESIPAEILQRVIGEFSRRIRNCIVARGGFLDTGNKTLKS